MDTITSKWFLTDTLVRAPLKLNVTLHSAKLPHHCAVSVFFLASLQKTAIAPYGEMFLYNNPESTPVRQHTSLLADSE